MVADIPKIIHTIAPADKSKWHPIWDECYQSWFRHFDSREFRFIMWDDVNSLSLFVEKNYEQFFSRFEQLEYKIMKIDIAKLLILHKFGGIYHDMDYYCYKNFFDYLKNNFFDYLKNNRFAIVASSEDSRNITNEQIQNSLIISLENNNLFLFLVEAMFNNIELFRKHLNYQNFLKDPDPYILYLTGPKLLQNFLGLFNFDEDLPILNNNLFNPPIKLYNEEMFTKHVSTYYWSKFNVPISNIHKINSITLKNFDFYKNYEL